MDVAQPASEALNQTTATNKINAVIIDFMTVCEKTSPKDKHSVSIANTFAKDFSKQLLIIGNDHAPVDESNF